jgi:hypothetical protein
MNRLANIFNLLLITGMTCVLFHFAFKAINSAPLVKHGIIKTVKGQGDNFENK